ncbi:uncharacterized protein LOC110755477 [Prunus avium]|uniref:Uncharacterized protein LOC110755477 n=1 Tax=Prunus avium TaxID=42229 RepID=A0A6P5S5X6_PRUAV|nr:uncharacterized protein LOC110755477 [Prunus avium]
MAKKTNQSEKKCYVSVEFSEQWCIYRIPSKLRNVKSEAYTPQLISIGPFHHGNPKLRDMERHKMRYYENFCQRTWKTKEELENFIREKQEDILRCYAGAIEPNFIREKEEDILRCYAGAIEPNFIREKEEDILRCYAGAIEPDIDFLKVILIDACFILELFFKNVNCQTEKKENYYLLRSPLLRKAVEQDLILLENQLPYPLLQALYDFAIPTNSSSNPGKNVQEKEEADDLHNCLPCFQPCFPISHSTPSRSDDHRMEIEKTEHAYDHPCFQPCFPISRSTTSTSDDHRMETKKTEPAYDHPFLKLTCEFFKEYTKLQPIKNEQVKHFTDLVRYFMWPEKEIMRTENMNWEGNGEYIRTKTIYDVRKLKEAGVKFRPNEGERYVIKRVEDHKCNFKMACFRNMNLKLTKFRARYGEDCIIRNVMALEQLMYPEEAYVCSYFLMLDQLVDTVEDVNALIESHVIVNLLSSSDAVAKLINSLCQEIMVSGTCYTNICSKLKEHYETSFCNRNISILKRVYFKDLWTGSSTILGLFVLVFSIIVSIKSLMK